MSYSSSKSRQGYTYDNGDGRMDERRGMYYPSPYHYGHGGMERTNPTPKTDNVTYRRPPESKVSASGSSNKSDKSERITYYGAAIAIVLVGIMLGYNMYKNKLKEATKQRLPMNEMTASNMKKMLSNELKKSSRYEKEGSITLAIDAINAALWEISTLRKLWTHEEILRATGINIDEHQDDLITRQEALTRKLKLLIEDDKPQLDSITESEKPQPDSTTESTETRSPSSSL